jgi:transcriptional regulator with XRE-family HTH domain
MTSAEIKAIGQRVKKVRESLLMDQTEFGVLLDIKQGRVSNMEGGGSVPTPAQMAVLFKKHKVSANYVYLGIPPMFLSKSLAGALKELESISKATHNLKDIINGI